ncbi:MAG TPA: hypothetical protein VFT30_06365, partial [Nitrospira sp.]|nr:hypothetical protein [Nitrospira sp.]
CSRYQAEVEGQDSHDENNSLNGVHHPPRFMVKQRIGLEPDVLSCLYHVRSRSNKRQSQSDVSHLPRAGQSAARR